MRAAVNLTLATNPSIGGPALPAGSVSCPPQTTTCAGCVPKRWRESLRPSHAIGSHSDGDGAQDRST